MTTFPEEAGESPVNARLKGVLELAFLGDAVFELLVREYISRQIDTFPGRLHAIAVR